MEIKHYSQDPLKAYIQKVCNDCAFDLHERQYEPDRKWEYDDPLWTKLRSWNGGKGMRYMDLMLHSPITTELGDVIEFKKSGYKNIICINGK